MDAHCKRAHLSSSSCRAFAMGSKDCRAAARRSGTGSFAMMFIDADCAFRERAMSVLTRSQTERTSRPYGFEVGVTAGKRSQFGDVWRRASLIGPSETAITTALIAL